MSRLRQRREAIERALRRRSGMSPAAKERLDAHNEQAEWTAACRACGCSFRGLKSELPTVCSCCGAGGGG